MAHSSRSRFQTRTARRRVSWTSGPIGGTGALSASGSTLFPTAQQAALDDLTIVRLHGSLLLLIDSVAALGDGFSWSFGICVVSENAAGIGVTAVPEPLTDVAWDGWFVHEQGDLKGVTTTTMDNLGGKIERRSIDSKAMRKLHNTDVVIAVLQVVETGDAAMRAFFRSRMLSKLP